MIRFGLGENLTRLLAPLWRRLGIAEGYHKPASLLLFAGVFLIYALACWLVLADPGSAAISLAVATATASYAMGTWPHR